jgi:hypothetical protein
MPETVKMHSIGSGGVVRFPKAILKQLDLPGSSTWLCDVRRLKTKEGKVITGLFLIPTQQLSDMLIDQYLREG